MYEVCEAPETESRLPSIVRASLTPEAYGVAESWEVETTRMFGTAVSFSGLGRVPLNFQKSQ